MIEKLISLFSLLTLFLVSTDVQVCTTLQETYTQSSHFATLTDGTVMFEYDYLTEEKSNVRLYDGSLPSLYYFPTTTEHSVSYKGQCNYEGTVKDGNNLIYKMLEDGYSVTSYYACSSYYDMRLEGKNEEVRVIVFKNNLIKFFRKNSEKIYNNSTYINEE